MTDDEIRFEYAKNIATNGRVFSILLVAICIAFYHGGAGRWALGMAVLAALPVGLSCIVDQLPRPAARVASVAVYLLSVVVAVILLLATFG